MKDLSCHLYMFMSCFLCHQRFFLIFKNTESSDFIWTKWSFRNFSFFFHFKIFVFSIIVDLPCSVNFCCTAEWPSHIYIYIERESVFISDGLSLLRKLGSWSSWELSWGLGRVGSYGSGPKGDPGLRPLLGPGLTGRPYSRFRPGWSFGAAFNWSLTDPRRQCHMECLV